LTPKNVWPITLSEPQLLHDPLAVGAPTAPLRSTLQLKASIDVVVEQMPRHHQ
jgi:hypothetical protein